MAKDCRNLSFVSYVKHKDTKPLIVPTEKIPITTSLIIAAASLNQRTSHDEVTEIIPNWPTGNAKEGPHHPHHIASPSQAQTPRVDLAYGHTGMV